VEGQLDQATLSLRKLEIENERNELAESIRTKGITFAEKTNAAISDLNDAKRLAEINAELRNTIGATGVPFSSIRRAVTSGAAAVGSLFGFDTSKAQRIVDLVDEFDKTSARFAVQAANTMFAGDKNITNFQLQTVSRSTPNLAIASNANDRIIADHISTILEGTSAAGINVANRAEFEDLSKKLKGQVPTRPTEPTQTEAALTLSEVNAMTQQQADQKIEELGAEGLAKLPDDVFRALRAKFAGEAE
jgi:hypothetical protein